LFDALKNELPYISGKNSFKILANPSKLRLTIKESIPKMKVLCDLSKKEKLDNENCLNFARCKVTNNKYCFDNDKGAICEKGFIYGI